MSTLTFCQLDSNGGEWQWQTKIERARFWLAGSLGRFYKPIYDPIARAVSGFIRGEAAT